MLTDEQRAWVESRKRLELPEETIYFCKSRTKKIIKMCENGIPFAKTKADRDEMMNSLELYKELLTVFENLVPVDKKEEDNG